MVDHATPNLPARQFDATEKFYAALGFRTDWKDDGWMILQHRTIQLEFFPHPDLDPAQSWFSCCIRLDDLDAFVELCRQAGIEDKTTGWPRLNAPQKEASGMRIAYLVDADGTLLRLVENQPD